LKYTNADDMECCINIHMTLHHIENFWPATNLYSDHFTNTYLLYTLPHLTCSSFTADSNKICKCNHTTYVTAHKM